MELSGLIALFVGGLVVAFGVAIGLQIAHKVRV